MRVINWVGGAFPHHDLGDKLLCLCELEVLLPTLDRTQVVIPGILKTKENRIIQ